MSGNIHNSKIQASPRPPVNGVSREIILARFIRLCASVLSTPLTREAAAIIVNRIAEIVRVDRAVLVRLKGKYPIEAVTGGGTAAQDNHFADAVETVRRLYRNHQEPVIVPSAGSDPKAALSAHLEKVQKAMGGSTILWLPLWMDKDGRIPPSYALWLERWHAAPWDRDDIELLRHAALFLGHGIVRKRAAPARHARRVVRVIMLLALLTVLALPTTSSVTSPARVMPDRPHHIFAPMDGILKDLYVQPGQWVKKDALLFRYDARVLDKRLDEAHRAVAVAKAKLMRLEGAAHRDREARAELPIQQMEVERAEADVRFYAAQQARAAVKTTKAGVIVLDDPDSLTGAALQTGQLVLSIADPEKTKLRIMVPAGDISFLKEGARVSIRLDSDPIHALPAIITRIGFDVKISEDQIPSVLAEAIWVGNAPQVQPGQKGSAKIFSDETTFLGMQILRKPLIAIRSVTGW